MDNRVVFAVAAACALVAASGCGADKVSVTGVSAGAEPAFDPCTLPDDAVRAVGADPASRDPGIFGCSRQIHTAVGVQNAIF